MDLSDPALAQQENGSVPPHIDPVSPAEPKPAAISRAEIDTSAPFESVKEAATRFGGFGFWRPASLKPSSSPSLQEFDAAKMEEEAAQLEKDLIAKETETFNVLKELEITKVILEELKLKLQEGGNGNNGESPALPELKQAEPNLASELAGIRAAIDSCKEKIEVERLLVEETGQRLSSNSSKASFLEEELKETKMKLAAAKRMKRAEEELRESKKALEEAASRVEVAEEVLRRRRRRRHYYSSTPAPATLSIGQILRRKLQEAEEVERRKKRSGKRKVSLGQLLSSGRLKDYSYYNDKQSPAKRKRFGGFSGISLLVTKQSKMKEKKKRQISGAGFRCRDV